MKATFELFAKKGISFSLTEVSNIVGIKKASIYAHFENKDMLLHQVIDEEMKKYFFEINQEKDDLEKFFFSFLHYFKESETKLLFWKRLLLLPPESMDSRLLDKIHAMTDERYSIVKNLIKRDINSGIIKDLPSEEICLTFFSLMHGLLSSVLIYHPQDIKVHYNSIWNIFWNGITN
jgi:AcrR family transcriptional regulator